jgi:squalene-associated FAD-dependent desaturase
MNAVEQRGSRDLPPVVVVGGGLSGLSAAVHLAARDISVLLLEQKQHLGGRTYSFVDATTGETIDNGQHVLIRGYAATMRLVEIIGTTHLLTVQPSPVLALHHPRKGIRTFRLPLLPSPLHLAAGVLSSDLFSVPDRLRVLRAGMAMRRDSGRLERELASMTVDEWLTSMGQSREAVRSFWEPLAVSIMNEHVTTASALLFVRSLKTAFLEGRSNAALVIPTVGLSDLFARPAREYITRHGGNVRCSTRAVKVSMSNGAVAGVVLQDGSTLEASAVVLAVPPVEALELVPEDAEVRADLTPSAALKFSPIVSTHLWFRREVMDRDVVGLIGKTVQWVFNRRRLAAGGGEGGHISATISAAHEIVGAAQEEIVTAVMRDLRSAFGQDMPDPWHALVIREKRATFSATPEAEHLRPKAATRVRNLFLAGDWTDTGYPATIEGAVMSGERCAALAAAL